MKFILLQKKFLTFVSQKLCNLSHSLMVPELSSLFELRKAGTFASKLKYLGTEHSRQVAMFARI